MIDNVHKGGGFQFEPNVHVFLNFYIHIDLIYTCKKNIVHFGWLGGGGGVHARLDSVHKKLTFPKSMLILHITGSLIVFQFWVKSICYSWILRSCYNMMEQFLGDIGNNFIPFDGVIQFLCKIHQMISPVLWESAI